MGDSWLVYNGTKDTIPLLLLSPNCLARHALVITLSCYGALEIVGVIIAIIVSYSPLNTPETVRDRGLVPKKHQ